MSYIKRYYELIIDTAIMIDNNTDWYYCDDDVVKGIVDTVCNLRINNEGVLDQFQEFDIHDDEKCKSYWKLAEHFRKYMLDFMRSYKHWYQDGEPDCYYYDFFMQINEHSNHGECKAFID